VATGVFEVAVGAPVELGHHFGVGAGWEPPRSATVAGVDVDPVRHGAAPSGVGGALLVGLGRRAAADLAGAFLHDLHGGGLGQGQQLRLRLGRCVRRRRHRRHLPRRQAPGLRRRRGGVEAFQRVRHPQHGGGVTRAGVEGAGQVVDTVLEPLVAQQPGRIGRPFRHQRRGSAGHPFDPAEHLDHDHGVVDRHHQRIEPIQQRPHALRRGTHLRHTGRAGRTTAMSVINCECSFPDGHDRTSHQEPNDTKDTDPGLRASRQERHRRGRNDSMTDRTTVHNPKPEKSEKSEKSQESDRTRCDLVRPYRAAATAPRRSPPCCPARCRGEIVGGREG
jgi:hypothetical protein